MWAKISKPYYLAVVALLVIVPSARSQTLQINNPASGNILDGIYVGSYGATNLGTGASVQLICDDFKDDSDYNVATYTTNTFSSLGSALWGSTLLKAGDSMTQITQLYDEAAWLTLGMLKLTGTQQGYYSFAIWAVFDTADVASWLTSHGDIGACNAVFGTGAWSSGTCTPSKGTGGLLATAAGQGFSPGEFANVLILTPTGCTSGPGSCPEQEFFEVVGEGGSTLAYLLFAGLTCFAAIRFSGRQQAGRN